MDFCKGRAGEGAVLESVSYSTESNPVRTDPGRFFVTQLRRHWLGRSINTMNCNGTHTTGLHNVCRSVSLHLDLPLFVSSTWKCVESPPLTVIISRARGNLEFFLSRLALQRTSGRLTTVIKHSNMFNQLFNLLNLIYSCRQSEAL